jgi:hypothetical protein
MIGGIISTATMTLTEIPSWKKWGLHGVFEWHENQVISTHFVHLPDAKRKGKNNFGEIFFLHFLNGTLAGIAFSYIISFLVHSTNLFSSCLLGISYGIVLWILTLAPIHKPITGFSLWNHPFGHLPALASFGGHIVYGIVLGLVVAFIKQ